MASPGNKQQPVKPQTERVVGFDCEFVQPPPDVLQSECPVCLQIVREPHQVTCCGYSYCHSCIQRIKASNKSCPTCKEVGFTDFPNKGLKRSLYSLKVRCSHQKDGCEWMGELRKFDEHLNTDPLPGNQLNVCWFAEIECLYCEEKMRRKYIQTHQTEHCTKRPFSCEHCHDYKSNYDDVIHNHWPVCQCYPIPCPNECGYFPQYQNLYSHVADECPLTTISCDFLQVGCSVNLPRKDMPDHLRENLITHMSLLATSHAKQQAQITKQHTDQQAQIASLVTDNKTLRSKNVKLENNHHSLETNFTKQKTELKTLREENAQLKKQLATLSQELNIVSLIPPVLTMTNFQQHKAAGTVWYSPPVYTHHQGYKICLKVYSNGWDSGKGTHVSVIVYFMRGEFDDSLKWPFRGVISFQLLDQAKGENHETDSNIYDDTIEDRYCGRVTEGERAKSGRGTPKFIAHTKLEPKYLRNDTLLFQIHKVVLKKF